MAHPNRTPKKMPMAFIPKGVRDPMGGKNPIPNIITKTMRHLI
jgi:hypothetical protein